jgi:hypothetical protein
MPPPKSNMTNFDLAGFDAGAAFGPNFFPGKIRIKNK